jgi:hypothetical protein
MTNCYHYLTKQNLLNKLIDSLVGQSRQGRYAKIKSLLFLLVGERKIGLIDERASNE